MDDNGVKIQSLVETENFEVIKATSSDGEVVYHVELFNVTLHLYVEEWQEFVALIQEAANES